MQKPEASIAIQVVPKAPNNEEAVRIIDAVIAHLKGSGLPTYVGPFETSVEGDYDTLMQLVKDCQLICTREGAPSVAAYVKISYNPNAGVMTIDEKVTKHHQ
ncbi:MAG: thiamine-binding protein [Clostridiales bacterium]|uniref:Uncharacterized protein YqgV (UPF0045/DUF77 family) n=1 Tax=Harryflintia acetispora TaxID=1849041 RepID=A0A9X8UL44_9FIRM|nr:MULTISPECIES: thiamine-binding protein [Oscillospiraceae]PWM39030.1 MAG: thiamine-binding protein [Clostridiales bacterium]RGB70067.1 thiamine-binding protein [Harryflintia acetispora]TCL44574.1 uncharacterized protein YqgV (UPF0045/DUF77 family) [Harryflintia acetispora]